MSSKPSIIEFFPKRDRHGCGYCKKIDCSYALGMWVHIMTVSDYQLLIDRGWRRSGQYFYKPTMDTTCCPMYTIKCDALDFKLTKSQKKVLKKVCKFVSTSKDNAQCTSASNEDLSSSQETGEPCNDFLMEMSNRKHKYVDISDVASSSSSSSAPKMGETSAESDKTKSEGTTTDHGDISNIPCKKAKQLRIQRKKDKMLKKGIEWSPVSQNANTSQKTSEKTLEDYLEFLKTSPNFKIKLVRSAPPSHEWLSTSSVTHKLFVKYQGGIHKEAPTKCTVDKYEGFLVHSPLQPYLSKDNLTLGYGSFHQQYWLNDELIAVGVIDILPNCVSSVYFYYDTKYSFLSLGTFAALQEIAFTRRLNKMANDLKYYYLGYYINSCPKMKYKGNYCPSFLLCPETYKWFPMEECIPKIDKSPYCRLNPDLDDIDEDVIEERDINHINILFNNFYMKYSIYKAELHEKDNAKVKTAESTLLTYGQLVGKPCSQSIIYVLH